MTNLETTEVMTGYAVNPGLRWGAENPTDSCKATYHQLVLALQRVREGGVKLDYQVITEYLTSKGTSEPKPFGSILGTEKSKQEQVINEVDDLYDELNQAVTQDAQPEFVNELGTSAPETYLRSVKGILDEFIKSMGEYGGSIVDEQKFAGALESQTIPKPIKIGGDEE